MELWHFMGGAVIVSLSGVMAPGPMTAMTIGHGSKSPHAGFFVALGHAVVEFPLMIFLYLGFGLFLEHQHVQTGIGLVGGLFLIIMGFQMLQSSLKKDAPSGEVPGSASPFAGGIMLSIGNPYFLLWWITVGIVLLMGAAKFGLAAVAIFMVVHWLCDLVWFYFLSALSFRGGTFFGNYFQRAVFMVCGFFLFIFGGKFIYDASKAFFI